MELVADCGPYAGHETKVDKETARRAEECRNAIAAAAEEMGLALRHGQFVERDEDVP
jgi:hypothetical protein